jgi:hypothetical protein
MQSKKAEANLVEMSVEEVRGMGELLTTEYSALSDAQLEEDFTFYRDAQQSYSDLNVRMAKKCVIVAGVILMVACGRGLPWALVERHCAQA